MLVDHALERSRAEQHEGELAALTDHQAETAGRDSVEAPPTAEQIEDHRLDGNETDHDGKQRDRLGSQHPEVDRHADGDEEHGQQQALERSDIGLDLMAILGVRPTARRR